MRCRCHWIFALVRDEDWGWFWGGKEWDDGGGGGNGVGLDERLGGGRGGEVAQVDVFDRPPSHHSGGFFQSTLSMVLVVGDWLWWLRYPGKEGECLEHPFSLRLFENEGREGRGL